jgi:hypothetical protein
MYSAFIEENEKKKENLHQPADECGIRGIAPVDIWRRATGNAIVQATQQTAAKTCMY